MAVTDADHVFFLVRQSQVYTHVSKLMDFPSSHEMALSHMERSVKLLIINNFCKVSQTNANYAIFFLNIRFVYDNFHNGYKPVECAHWLVCPGALDKMM